MSFKITPLSQSQNMTLHITCWPQGGKIWLYNGTDHPKPVIDLLFPNWISLTSHARDMVQQCVLWGLKKNEYISSHLLSASNWANNQINTFTRTWGIHISMKIQKTMREGWVYMTLLDKGKEEWSIRFQKWEWAVHGYLRKSKTHVAGKFLLGNWNNGTCGIQLTCPAWGPLIYHP